MRLVVLLCLFEAASGSLEAAFRAFAECEDSRQTRDSLEERLAFFARSGMVSEDDVRRMAEHEVRNEREKVLSLQSRLLRPGTSVRLHNLANHPELNGCEGTLLSCVRDGSFVCIVEMRCGPTWEMNREPFGARVLLENLLPAPGCDIHDAASVCTDSASEAPELFNDGEIGAEALSEAAIGQMMVDEFKTHERLAKRGELPAWAEELGPTNFPDLPYSALVLVLVRLVHASCEALRKGDAAGVVMAVEKALELEESARQTATEREEVHLAIRQRLASLLAVRSAAKALEQDRHADRGAPDQHSARDDALLALRLNVTSSIALGNIDLALTKSQLRAPYALAGLTREKIVLLQQWFSQLPPLYRENEGPKSKSRSSSVGVERPSHDEV
jgi:hypothetical protein